MSNSPHKFASLCDQQFGVNLRDFCARYELTLRPLECMFNEVPAGPSKSTICNMQKGRASAAVIKKATPAMLHGISNFLRSRGLNHQEVIDELTMLFPKENLDQMSAPRTVLDDEHIDYFGLADDPFTADPSSARDVFTTPQLDKILGKLEDAVNFQKFVALVGDIGAGKTIMRRRLLVAANRSAKMKIVSVKFAKMKRITSADIVVGILEALKQRPRARLTLAQVQLEDYLKDMQRQDIRVALEFDEAHRLHPDTTSELKNFFELSDGGFGKVLGLILFGQPQLRDRLQDMAFREITERVRVINMPSMSRQAQQYVAHRLRIVGGDLNKLFEPGAIKIIADQVSTPQAIGNLCNAALIKAHDAGDKKVLAAMVKSEFGGPQVRSQRPARP